MKALGPARSRVGLFFEVVGPSRASGPSEALPKPSEGEEREISYTLKNLDCFCDLGSLGGGSFLGVAWELLWGILWPQGVAALDIILERLGPPWAVLATSGHPPDPARKPLEAEKSIQRPQGGSWRLGGQFGCDGGSLGTVGHPRARNPVVGAQSKVES